ncbi:hypothetical protein BHE74_00048463 [Ensete ventricosum]|nr:hypothetical protein BHE74_00048463 [Ensete ventricosum]
MTFSLTNFSFRGPCILRFRSISRLISTQNWSQSVIDSIAPLSDLEIGRLGNPRHAGL